MNITQLQYLVDVGELGSFTNAAKKNDVTIPAISISINKLEKIFGAPLFTRSKKGVVPTTEGKVCIQHAITILKTAKKMKKDVSISKNKVGGNIVVATHPGVISHVFKATLDLRREFPNVKVNLVEGDTIFVINHVKNGHADMGFVSYGTNFHDESLSWEPIVRDEVVLVVSKRSSLRFNNNIKGEEIQDEIIVLYNDPYVKMFAKELVADGLPNKVDLISNNSDALYQMVIQENAISISTKCIVHSLPTHIKSEIVTIPIHKLTINPPSYLWRLTRKNDNESDLIRRFTDYLLSYYK